MKNKWSIVGLVAAISSAVISVISSIADRKNQEILINKKVSEAVAKLVKKEESRLFT